MMHVNLSDWGSAVVFNAAMIAAAMAAMGIQVWEGWRKSFPMGTWLTVIALMNVLLLLGSRLGGFSPSDWSVLFTEGILPMQAPKTVMGGLILMLLFWLLIRRWWKLPDTAFDTIVLALPLAAAIGRIGCLFSGCCFGVPTHGDWGWCYGAGSPAFEWQLQQGMIPADASWSLPVHPVQGYFLVSNLLIFLSLLFLKNRFQHPGSLSLAGLMLILFFRTGHEFFREAATNRGVFGMMFFGMKTVQWICLFIGLLCLGLLIKRERKTSWNSRPSASFLSVSLSKETSLLLFITILAWISRLYLSFFEVIILLLSLIPALAGVAVRLYRMGWMNGRVLIPAIVSFLCLLTIADISADTLINQQDTLNKEEKSGPFRYWYDVGAGGTYGSWGLVTRDCSGEVVQVEDVRNSSFGAEGNVHFANDNVELVGGVRVIHGRAYNEDWEYGDTMEELRYSGFGVVGRVEMDWVGIGVGYMYLPRAIYLPESFGYRLGGGIKDQQAEVAVVNFRVGPVKTICVDFRYRDNQQYSFYPEPQAELGLNYGFNDPSGKTRLGFGLINMQEELGTKICLRFPIKKYNLDVDMGLYFQHGILFSSGIRYSFPAKQLKP